MERGIFKRKSFKVAFCGMMAALGTVILALGGFIPITTYCGPMAASYILIPVKKRTGKGGAWSVWFVTAFLSAILSPDKEAVFFYIFIGYYPAIRGCFEKIQNRTLRTAVKLLYFSASVTVMILVTLYVFGLESVVNEYRDTTLVMEIFSNLILVAMLMVHDKLIERFESKSR